MGRHQGIRRHDRRLISYNRRALIAGLAATLLAPRLARAGVTDGGDLSLHARARTAHRLATRQPAGGARIPLARCRRSARSGAHHRTRQHRQSRSRARAQTRPHPRRRQREPDLHLARRPGAAADGHSLRAARRPFRGYSVELPDAGRIDRAPRAGREPCAQRRRHDENHHAACGLDPA